MKKQLKSLLLIVLLIGYALPSWAQSSTEGKEFWVALTLSAAPAEGTPTPFIAVSTKKATTITITNPNDPNWAGVTRSVGADEWAVFESEIPLAQWYPTNANSIDNIKPEAGKTHNYGLKVVTDEDVSVYAALWMLNSFDAANILPLHVLKNEYYTQDYPPYIKPSDGDALAMFTILATENNTKVTITPSTQTQDGKAANVPFTVTLNAGQTYYVISQTLQTLSGSHVNADKPIAVFQGDVFTQIPGGKSARDCTYEQAMPIEYWGTNFVVTRSKEKDANRIRVTASTNGTSLSIDGYNMGIINAGETFEFEMRLNEPTQADLVHRADVNITADAVYLNTSCPVAVYSYDVSNAYKSTPSEMDNSRGDPSMVWISPLEQRINDITFGVCGTTKTDKHYIDIVCPTAATAQTTITPAPVETISWNTVDGNTQWSYARVHLSTVGKTGRGNRVFKLQNPQGCIAHVYGNGNDESYAYSVGSAAVEQGVKVNGETFTNGYRSDTRFCMGDTLLFDAKVGTDEIARVDWNFGDGITDYNSTAQIEHSYTVPGWYDVEADLYGHQVCTDEADQFIGKVKFSFRVVRQDTVWVDPSKHCLTQEEWADTIRIKGQNYLDSLVNFGRMEILNPDAPCTEPIQISLTTYGLETSHYSTVDEFDSAYVHGKWYFPQTLPPDGIVSWYTEYANEYGCRLYDTCYVHIKTCLDMDIPNSGAHACQGDTVILPFNYKKGDIAEAHFVYGKTNVKIEPKKKSLDWYFELPTDKLKPDYYQATITVQDTICNRKLEFPIEFAIYYPSTIFKCKFNNVLAVYNKENNGGYEFTGYQWLLNGAPIPGATQSVYHMDSSFVIGQYYSVILTRSDGVILPSCAQMIEKVNNYVSESNKAPATKHLINQRLVIRKDEKDYNIYGQRMK